MEKKVVVVNDSSVDQVLMSALRHDMEAVSLKEAAAMHRIIRHLPVKSIPRKGDHLPVKVKPMPGRNERCPCGSGKKYKRCCLNHTQ